MKTRNLFLALIATVFTVGTIMANEPVMSPKEVTTSVAEVIQDEMYYPEFAIEEKFQGRVAVEIQITEEGKFDVIAANSVYDDLKEYASKTIEGIETDEFKAYAGQKMVLYLNYDLKLF